MSFIVRNRRKGWKRSIPDESSVHPDIDCNRINIKHIYNNWVQPIQPPDRTYERLCNKPPARVIGMSSAKSRLLKNLLKNNTNLSYDQYPDFGNLYSTTTTTSSSTSNVCCDDQKLFIVKELTKSYEDFIFKKRETENYNSNTGCCKPFPYDINQKRLNGYGGLRNVEQAYLDYNYYGIIAVWDISLSLNEDLYIEYNGMWGIKQNIDFIITFPNITLDNVTITLERENSGSNCHKEITIPGMRLTSPSGVLLDVDIGVLKRGETVIDKMLHDYWNASLSDAMEITISPAHTTAMNYSVNVITSLKYSVHVVTSSSIIADTIEDIVNQNSGYHILPSGELDEDIAMKCGAPIRSTPPFEINLP